MFKTLEDLVKTIRDRKNSNLEESYTNQLLNNKQLSVEKAEEEFQELLKINQNQIHESADLFYHLLVLLESHNIKIEDVLQELEKRKSKSGLEEKANRS
jgi:phosphoribosyl-ATP pyrophosphohydrolase